MKLTKTYIFETLKEERLWKEGEADTFTFGDWELTLRKEERIYNPFTFSIKGKHKNGSCWSRRYVNMESAFLHILNQFNENANIKNKYKTISEALFDNMSEIAP